jgi:hypothetical protein
MNAEVPASGVDDAQLASQHAAREARALERELKAGALGATLIHTMLLVGTEVGPDRVLGLVAAIRLPIDAAGNPAGQDAA